MSFGGDPDFTFPGEPQPGEWKCCYHPSIDQQTGICNDCGKRAAIMIHLEKREPMEKDTSLAVEEFESACDAAIGAIGAGNANTILNQRRERNRIIVERNTMEKALYSNQAGMAGQLASYDSQVRALSQQEATARDAKERLKEENAAAEAAHIEGIKALNRDFF
jgi:hypothetical protein